MSSRKNLRSRIEFLEAITHDADRGVGLLLRESARLMPYLRAQYDGLEIPAPEPYARVRTGQQIVANAEQSLARIRSEYDDPGPLEMPTPDVEPAEVEIVRAEMPWMQEVFAPAVRPVRGNVQTDEDRLAQELNAEVERYSGRL